MPTSIFELFRDPIWQFIGVLIGLATIVTAYLQHRANTKRIELAFGVLAVRKLVSIADDMTSRISIQLDGHPVSNVYMVEYGVKNSGNQSILRNSFDGPFRIDFSPKTTVLNAQITIKYPQNLAVAVSSQGSVISVDPLLLNSGDYFVIQTLTSGESPSHKLGARIAGVSSVAQVNTGWRVPPLPFFPFSHPMNGASMAVWSGTALAVLGFVFGSHEAMAIGISMAGLMVCVALFSWFAGEQSRNGGRYIDRT